MTAPTEFRVFVQADTTDGQARYIGLDRPNADDGDITKSDDPPLDPAASLQVAEDTKAAEGQTIKFQRATSVHFAVNP